MTTENYPKQINFHYSSDEKGFITIQFKIEDYDNDYDFMFRDFSQFIIAITKRKIVYRVTYE